jgi:PIN domain nuclease of toxin-antitoxin system
MRDYLLRTGLKEIPVDGEIAVRSVLLNDFHRDPADRLIVATAMGGHELMTADERILGWRGEVARLDARV